MNIRAVRVEDLAGMQDCNLHNLPENYTMKYCSRLSPHFIQTAKIDRIPRPDLYHALSLAFTFAKMEEQEEPEGQPATNHVPHGHVTSISVMRSYRRLGLAKKLMLQSQEAMSSIYRAAFVSLHVRKSNRAALSLYRDTLGFTVNNIEEKYYADGEDAYAMQLTFEH
ncbi:silencing group B protein [Suillus lakei]|nr:silencing group B protein [Suillus lakei]